MATWDFAKLFIPHTPSMTYKALKHSMGFGPHADDWDSATFVIVQAARLLMSGKLTSEPSTILESQARSVQRPPVKGNLWVATCTIPRPGPQTETLRDAVFNAIHATNAGQSIDYTKPELADLEVEWTGYRTSTGEGKLRPPVEKPQIDLLTTESSRISKEEKVALFTADSTWTAEKQKFDSLMDDPARTSETTVLYFHGGAYYMADPATHRSLTSLLAKECGGRVCSVRYRLAPQTAFPGQLLDAFMVYLSLLYPPPGSFHAAIPASKIVVGGDSAGGNLAFALLQLLLQLHQNAQGLLPTVIFHGREVDVPMPAGVSANSGWFDITRALPSMTTNIVNDFLPPADHKNPTSRYRHDSVWPTKPPRGDVFCDLSLLDHPLVSPVLAESWKGSPPLWLCTGQEMIQDEDLLVAARAANQNVPVHLEHYEAMPHCFAMLLSHLATSARCVRSWGQWARKCVELPSTLKTNGTFIYAKTGKEAAIDVLNPSIVTFEEARRLIKDAKMQRIEGWMQGNTFPEPAL